MIANESDCRNLPDAHIALSIHQTSTVLFDNDTFAPGQIKSIARESGPLFLASHLSRNSKCANSKCTDSSCSFNF